MKTIQKRHLLPLAAIALIAAACDPFTAKPGGDPRVVRVITTDQDWTTHIETVENTGASAGTVAVTKAYPGDKIVIHFNKPMKGSTLQKYTDVDTNIPHDATSDGIRSNPADPGFPLAKPPVPPTEAYDDPGHKLPACLAPDNLTLTGFEETPEVKGVWDPAAQDFEPGTGVYRGYTSVCYYPQAVTDGAQLVIKPAKGMVVGTTYSVKGTVQDYEGKPLVLDITITVSDLPVASIGDTLQRPSWGRSYYYGAYLNWFPRPVVAGGNYLAQAVLDVGTGIPPDAAAAAWTDLPTKTVDAVTGCVEALQPDQVTEVGYKACETYWGELDPNRVDANGDPILPAQTYWFRVSSDGGTTWTVSDGTTDIRGPFNPTLLNFSDPLAGPANVPGAVQIPWARYLGTGVANSAAGAFPPPGALIPAQPANMPDYIYPWDPTTTTRLTGDKTVIVERIETTLDAAGDPVEPAADAAGWTDITASMHTIDDVVTNTSYNDLFSPYGVNITAPFAKSYRVGVDKSATSGTGYWYRVRPNYASGKVINGVPKYKKAF
jgi:hypothetical protein